MPPIYLDAFATTPLDPRVGHELRPWIEGRMSGNAGSPHQVGELAAEALAEARRQIAGLVNAAPSSVLITSGATESNNLALRAADQEGRRHVVACATEHPSVREPLRALAADRGVEVTWLRVDRLGNIDLDELQRGIRRETSLVSVMAANNETGTLHPVADVGAMAATAGVLFHCDAAQAAGKVPVDVARDAVDLLSISAHKMYGPMGVGALVVSERAKGLLSPLLRGGGQEQGLRSGTVNVMGAVGLGAACELAAKEMLDEAAHLARLRDRLEEALLSVGGVSVNGDCDRRLPGSLSVTVEDVPADALLSGCPGLAFSRGSACTSGSPAPSHVLTAMGLTSEEADSTVRFGLTRFTTEAEVDAAIAQFELAVDRIRALVHA